MEQSVTSLRNLFPRPRVRYWCSDESRVGLLSIPGRKLTGFGVKSQARRNAPMEFPLSLALWGRGAVEWRVVCVGVFPSR